MNPSNLSSLSEASHRPLQALGSSLLLKLLMLLFFCLLALIPLSQLSGLLREREQRQDEVATEIAGQWGERQRLIGPMVMVPGSTEVASVENGQPVVRSERFTACFLPERFALEGQLDPEWRYRGIFRSPVYSGNIRISGNWIEPDWSELGCDPDSLDWSQARVVFKVSDTGGIVSSSAALDGEEVEPRPFLGGPFDGEWTRLGPVGLPGIPGAFELSLGLRGSRGLMFLPIGRVGEATLSSSWSNPSFVGGVLPMSRTVGDAGFEATWQFSEFGRGLPSGWLETSERSAGALIEQGLCGVELLDPVNGYRLVDRSLKYGFLFVGAAFGVFFLFEALCSVPLHAMQYLLVGLGNVLFFLLLLSLSEIAAFGVAYLIASAATCVMVGLYARAVLRERRRAAVVGASLGILYGALYVILRQQDYALMAGSSLLFAALAVVMYLTRRLDWTKGRASGSA